MPSSSSMPARPIRSPSSPTSMRGRVTRLVPIKYKRMAASPFGFFRGAVPIMAADLSCHPNTGLGTQLCGDAHVENLGAYASLDSRIVFDLNDFDETIRGPFEWDIKRLATSVILAGREAGIGRAARKEAVSIFFAATGVRCAVSPTCRCLSWRATRFTASRTSAPCRPSSGRPSDPHRCACWKSSPSPSMATMRNTPPKKLRPRRPR